MKKITLFVCALCLAFTEISAQVFIGDNTEGISSTNSTPQTQTNAPSGQETTDSKKKYKDITDVTFEFNTDVNIYGFNMGDDHYHLGMIFGDDLFGVTFGYGLGKTWPIAHFAGCSSSQTGIPTGVLRDSNVSEYKSMVENAQ